MFVTGHIATAYLCNRLSGLHLGMLVGAALFPDLVDKPLKLAGLFDTGRHVAHNLIALSLTTLLMGKLGNWSLGRAWCAGYALHLAGDLPFSRSLPWLYPFFLGGLARFGRGGAAGACGTHGHPRRL